LIVDVVIKLGGGMLARGDSFASALAAVADVARHRRVLIVPGGGPFADTVREMDRRLGLPDEAAHWMAVLAMDQYANLIAVKLDGGTLVEDRSGITRALSEGKTPILVSTPWLRRDDPLPHSWAVTGDSIAAWVAGQVGARELILVKPPGATGTGTVDGHFHQALPPGVRWVIVAADSPEILRAAVVRA
jgi:aspartokinase-like uncharacterized kinase